MNARRMEVETNPQRARPLAVWFGAATFALMLHAATAGYWVYAKASDEVADARGAPALEIGFELAAPHLPPTEMPPGPETDASAASSAAADRQEKQQPNDLPKAQATETENPDRLVSTTEPEKPKVEDAKPSEAQSKAATESVASEATAPPTSPDVREASRATAPVDGVGDTAVLMRMTWEKQLVAHLNRHKRYPAGRSRRSVQVTVKFTLDRLGHVSSAAVAAGSGDAAFDQAALAMLRDADPVPRPPPLVADRGLDFTLPVLFRAK